MKRLVTIFLLILSAAQHGRTKPPEQVPFTTAQTAPWKTCTLEDYDSCFMDKERAMWAFKVLPANPKPISILLMHGLSDSPYLMKDVARIFAEHGYPVIAIRLSGMGTQKEALHLVQHEQWLDDVHYGFNEAKKLAPKVVVGGLSMGGYLSAHLAKELQDQKRLGELAGVAIFSPALKAIPFADYYACSAAWLDPSSYVSDSIFPGGGEDMRYMQMSNHGLCEFSKLYLNDDLLNSAKTMNLPLFLLLSKGDTAVDRDMAWNYAKAWPGSKEFLHYDTQTGRYPEWVTQVRVAQPLDHSWVMLRPAEHLLTGQVNVDFAPTEEALLRFIEKLR